MLPVQWRANAQEDLAAIVDYIAERNPQATIHLYDDVERWVSQLPNHPYLYRLVPIVGTRELIVHPNYVVIYRVTSSAIEIVAVVHSRQQYL